MGEIFALSCPLVWALAVILFRKSGETVSPVALNLFRVSLSSLLFLMTLLITGQDLWTDAPFQDYFLLILSGVIAIAISDTLFHMCLNRVGAGLNAIIDLLYSSFILLFAYLLLGETLTPVQMLGMICVVGGIAIAARVELPYGLTRRSLVTGIMLGVGAMSSLALGIVIAKPVLENHGILWATSVRQLGSLGVLLPAAALHPRRGEFFRVFRPQKTWKYTIPGTILGSYLALILWIGGMKHIPASKAGILNQTSTIYILIFASIFLKEKFTRRKAVAALVAMFGVILVLGLFSA